jgi:hypothetical protein
MVGEGSTVGGKTGSQGVQTSGNVNLLLEGGACNKKKMSRRVGVEGGKIFGRQRFAGEYEAWPHSIADSAFCLRMLTSPPMYYGSEESSASTLGEETVRRRLTAFRQLDGGCTCESHRFPLHLRVGFDNRILFLGIPP